ncbi:MAG TPA: ADP-ribosylation factor-like protein [Aggregatilineales bacterium]|nr:ADP-ribosylation factor-like protein [Aggregatilineales bacterium]
MLPRFDIEKSIRFLHDERSQWLHLVQSIQAAGESRDQRVVPQLEGLLEHPESVIRQAAQTALSALTQSEPQEAGTFYGIPGAAESHVLTVLVAGAHGAGKTAFIHTISDRVELVVPNESDDTLNAEEPSERDYGRLSVDSALAWYFLPTLGQKRLDSAWKLRVDKGCGCIVLVDSADPEAFHDTRLILDDFQNHTKLPIVVAANKQDLEDALPPDRLRRLLQVSSRVSIVPCMATNYEMTKRVLLELLTVMLDYAVE